jgi:Fur family ferric uptake transcriptional regulator
MEELAIKKLKKSGLRKTEIRTQILNYLLDKSSAISQPELEKKFKSISDRVTIYRALSAFEEKGIIHKIMDPHGTARYAVCKEDTCSDHQHSDEHIHFHCTSCDETTCLEEMVIPELKVPSTYSVQKINLNIEGVCQRCNG